jgi:hypothetical protein
LTLGEVIVKKGEDPAYEIIRHAIKKRSYYNGQVDSFSVDVYIKGLVRSRGILSGFLEKKLNVNPMMDWIHRARGYYFFLNP